MIALTQTDPVWGLVFWVLVISVLVGLLWTVVSIPFAAFIGRRLRAHSEEGNRRG